MSGLFQKRRRISGLPDVLVIAEGKPIFIELKSRRGVASKTQKQVRTELIAAGAVWWMARSANAALMALQGSEVPMRAPWTPQPLQPWEGPFDNPHQSLPQHPEVAARRREEQRRYRERLRARQDAEIAASGQDVLQSPTAGATP